MEKVGTVTRSEMKRRLRFSVRAPILRQKEVVVAAATEAAAVPLMVMESIHEVSYGLGLGRNLRGL